MIAQVVSCLCTSPIILLVVVLSLAVFCMRRIYSFWEMRGVPGPKPVWIIGNMYARLRPTHSMAEFDQMLYERYGGKRFCGYYEFTQPCLMVGDPELLKLVMVKDFDHFTDRSFVTFNEPVMDHMLLGLKGKVWKAVRSVMTPTFSSGKIKQTLQLVKDCAKNLVVYFDKELEKGSSTFEMKDVYGMFTMDTIASIAFGVNSDSLNNTQDEFSAAAARFFSPPPRWKRPIMFFQFLWPQIAKALRLNVIDRTPIHFFTKVVSDTIHYRLENNLRRSDFLQLLLDARLQEQTNNNKGNGSTDINSKKATNEVLNELVITAQCVLFYIAGYDTTATTLSFLSYCLALHPSIQQKCMEEIEEVLRRHKGELTYEALQEMTYLDMVFAETLRLYPPAPRVDRTVTKDFTLPDMNLTLQKGQKVTIPIYSIHRDPDHYPDPLKFDPERFSPENKAMRSQMVYLPFGSGPRNCIGMRFALMEAKVAAVYLLQEFAFIPSKKTQVPIVIEQRSGLLKAQDGIWVRLAKRTSE
ncbi:probable cytochrome P450 6a14 [Penaeus japonicus]|uniref:probable cytochrome P450 6a14 n=1 Tax=Penaeus japonicus TaxID=27405 RepID=UPI001C71405B|nr:probable cytochrome P450 6a14 [Penaeus japonicus]XP_042869794.1 probable cytochrome P450 6a14 [Penaeus japonicus]XP_042869795.1 probable cytochrome P450 6a14 [Penaeus japonicus]